MARPCSICEHPRRKEIDLAIASGQLVGRIATNFGIYPSSVYRHKKNGHVVQGIAEARAKESAVMPSGERLPAGPGDLVTEMRGLQDETLKILYDARDSGDARLALSAVSQAAKNIELLARLQGELVEKIQQDEKRLVIMKVVRASGEPVEKEQADGKANVDKRVFIDNKATEAD